MAEANDSDSEDDDLLFGNPQRCSEDFSGSDDDGPAFFGFDGGVLGDEKPAVARDAFHYSTPRPSDVDDDEYDAEYARQTREALSAMLDEADAALFGERKGSQKSAAATREQPSSSAKAEEDDTDAEVEELIACDGVLEEPIAAHIAAEEEGDDDGRADRRRGDRCSQPTEAWVLQKYGLPPRTPPLAIKEAVVSLLLDRLWRSIVVPRLACVSNAAARMLEQQQQPQAPPQHGQGDEGGAGMLPHEPRPPLHHPPLSPPRFAAGAGGAAAQALRSLGPGHGPSRARSAAPHH